MRRAWSGLRSKRECEMFRALEWQTLYWTEKEKLGRV